MAWKRPGVRIPISPQMQTKKFQRRIEDFICENCGKKVRGNGYTDHCPGCLYGKHIDVNPGDRTASCGGIMEPVHIYKKGDMYIVGYICKECGYEFRVKSASNDNFKTLIKLVEKSVIMN
jgi:hypothetical protein